MTMEIKPLRDQILVAPIKPELKTSGGIVKLERYQDDQKQFTVLAVGPGRRLKNGTVVPMEIKPGQKVLAEPYQDHFVFEDGRRMFKASNVLAVWD